jgi:chitodextrinase
MLQNNTFSPSFRKLELSCLHVLSFISLGSSSRNYDSVNDVGNQTSYTIQNLVEGQKYYITVTAYDTSNNESGYSSEVVYNVPDTTLPLTPTSLQATTISTSEIDLSWNASSDNIGVTGYRIYRGSTQIATTANSTYQDTGLSSSTTYSYTVSAYDAAGNESGQSSASSAITLSLPVNNPPVLSSVGNKSVNEGQALSFTISATDPDDDTLIYTTNNLPSGASFNGNTQTFAWTPTYNQAGTYSNITFQVSDGNDIDSENIAITVDNINRPPVLDPISDITVSEGATITLSPTATDPDGDALAYTYSGWMTSNSYTTNSNDSGTHTVTVTVSDGTLTDSQNVMITILDVDTVQPSTPGNLQASAISIDKINLSWNASTDNVGVTGYRIYRDGIQVADVSSTTYQDTGLSSLTTYVYTVSAYDATGNESNQSTPVSATTQEASTTFSNLDSYLGDASNWEPLTPSRWSVVSDGGDLRYGINTTSYSNLSGSRLGEYSLIQNRTYGDFTFTAKVKTTEDLFANGAADYAIVFGYQDSNNYYYMIFNSQASNNQLFKVVNGSRQLIADATNLAIPDNAYHDVTLQRTGTTVNVYFDNTLTLNATDSTFSSGQIGIGGFNDASLWDDIVVIDVDTILPSTPANLQATAGSTDKINLVWNASSDNVGVTGYKIYRDGIQVADISSTTYEDTGLSPSITYVYTVSAYDAAGNESSQSTPVSAADEIPPGRPTGMIIVGT